MSDARLWLAVLVALPALVIGASFLRLDVERLRRLAVASALVMLLVALVIPVSPLLHGLLDPHDGAQLGSRRRDHHSHRHALRRPAAVRGGTVAAHRRGDAARRARSARIAEDGARHPRHARLLSHGERGRAPPACRWPPCGRSCPHWRTRRIGINAASSRCIWACSTLLFGVGVALLVSPGVQNTTIETAGMWLIVVAALVRKGIVPFHAWVPEVFDHGRLGPAILFNAPQVGAYMTVVLIVPRASPEMLRVIALLALGTAVYGAALALVQTSARRACGYLFMSQSALVMAGLDCTSVSALAGGLLVWLSAGLAFAGLARCVLVLEARRGRLDLTTYHGGYERMPLLAISFLAMGLACTGFPGTLGFVGQELLVDGAVDAFPVMGFAVVMASALTGLAVLRMYFSLFCGRSDCMAHSGLRLGLTRTRSMDIRGARDRAGWLRRRTSPARRFTVRCQR